MAAAAAISAASPGVLAEEADYAQLVLDFAGAHVVLDHVVERVVRELGAEVVLQVDELGDDRGAVLARKTPSCGMPSRASSTARERRAGPPDPESSEPDWLITIAAIRISTASTPSTIRLVRRGSTRGRDPGSRGRVSARRSFLGRLQRPEDVALGVLEIETLPTPGISSAPPARRRPRGPSARSPRSNPPGSC